MSNPGDADAAPLRRFDVVYVPRSNVSKAGLFVHPYTFRNEPVYLTQSYHGDPTAEYKAYFELGVDGVFTDFSPTAHAALEQWRPSRPAAR